ncbi:MAG: peptide transporter ATP-binding protein [Rhodococcus erythropolis]|jgi:peptide/nickel transport system ATP-binding protein|uniref:dipeptide/oligopeptide/nickel ABC transporter ATP-binding protein n=1 Tax=Rhodococcus qingshengii TaxID=334542 RepID=UPI0024328B14|nr:dipeptide/oligopeptide/nickel ABC transporter ATP-binding protein [Rhodococcus erythropolis]MDF2894123.1 peptide transporter ATP-binding protein [Rhodococcus erythropolis]
MTLLEVNELTVTYPKRSRAGAVMRAVEEVSFSIERGETLGLVGESGSGKTTIGRALLGLAPVSSGRIRFDGQDRTSLSRRQQRALATQVQVIFQDPYTSLNPALTISDTLCEPLLVAGVTKSAARERVRELMDAVGLPRDAAQRYPSEFSGGQRQRVAIARALALSPQLIVCDEPTSALDLATQVRVLDLLSEIQDRTGIAYLFISHDLAVVRRISHRVAVLRGGRLIEEGTTAQVTQEPREKYTRELLLAAPIADPVRQRQRRAERSALALSELRGQGGA